MPEPTPTLDPSLTPAPDSTPILHLTERVLWDEARARGVYEMSTWGRTLQEEGFVHCSTAAQLPATAATFYADLDDLVVLVIDPALLGVPVRYEAARPGGGGVPARVRADPGGRRGGGAGVAGGMSGGPSQRAAGSPPVSGSRPVRQ
ncbi:DUF952 domain-containing protein [Streptomyces griseoviridis]|uniref:DUF952 domain-containing protein n=1 Tax=Streptomyces griseoviridis TaxID=45398 RepID=UPI003402111B